MCETDYSGYPDCRDNTIKALQVALSLGLDTRMVDRDPADVAGQGRHLARWRKHWAAQALVELIVEHTHTCYLGERGQRHAWGHGCGQCPACTLRRQGWEGFVAAG